MLAMSAQIVVGDLAACIAAIRPRYTPAATNATPSKEEYLGV